jgi:hypothetical protein
MIRRAGQPVGGPLSSNVRRRKHPVLGQNMKFRTIPPDPAEIPRARLVVPPSIPILIVALAWVAERAGHTWNIHGDAAALIVLFGVSLLVALVASASALVSVIPAVRHYPSLRTKANILCIAFASVFVAAAVALVLYTVARVACA